MDVTLPDGTIINGVPEGTTKAQLAQKLQANGMNVPKEWLAPTEPAEDTRPWYKRSGSTLDNRVNAAENGIVNAGAHILASIPDAVPNLYNLGKAAVGSAYQAASGKPAPDWLQAGEANPIGNWLSSKAGGNVIPDQNDTTSRYLYAAGGAVPSIATGRLDQLGPAALNVTRNVIPQIGAQAVADKTKGTAWENAAPILTALALQAAPSAASSATKRLINSNPAQTAENVAAFEAVGTTPTVGQATGSRTAQAIESGLSRVPGSAGVLTRKANAQQEAFGNKINSSVDQLSKNATGEDAGLSIKNAIAGDSGFVDKFKAAQSDLYNKLDSFIPKDSAVSVINTRKALDSLTTPKAGAVATSGGMINSKIATIAENLSKDSQGKMDPTLLRQVNEGTIPYSALKQLRTMVGNELSDATLTSDVPRSQWKQLYAALSSDVEGAAKNAGTDAHQAWKQANAFTKAGMEKIDFLQGITDKSTPEAIYKAATAGSSEGPTTIRNVMNAVDVPTQKQIAGTFLKRMGTAKAGAQDESGGKFSTETFLTNWSKLDPAAKSALFDKFPEVRGTLDNMAKVSANLREGSKVFANPSGTSQARTLDHVIQGLIGGTTGTLAAMGNPMAAAGILGGMGIANRVATMAVSPKSVDWLMSPTDLNMGNKAMYWNSGANPGMNQLELTPEQRRKLIAEQIGK